MTKLELNEIETLSLLASNAMHENKGTAHEGLYKTIHHKLVQMFDEEYQRFINNKTDTI